jgi:hypothetical protein
LLDVVLFASTSSIDSLVPGSAWFLPGMSIFQSNQSGATFSQLDQCDNASPGSIFTLFL